MKSLNLSVFQGKRILIIGDVMLDESHYGHVHRKSPEADIPVVLVDKSDYRLGGAGNVAINVQSLGGIPILVGCVGLDDAGRRIRLKCSTSSVSDQYLIESPGRPSTVKSRIFSDSKQLLRFDIESDADIDSEMECQLIELLTDLIQPDKIDAIILQDYNKGVLTEGVIQYTLETASKNGIPVIVDPKKNRFFSFRNSSIFKPNLKELREALQVEINPTDRQSLINAAKLLLQKMPYSALVLTLSENGVFWYTANGNSGLIAAHQRNILDVSGAGDTVVAVLTLAMASTYTTEECSALANLAGGLVCEMLGVESLSLSKLQQAIERS